jgi:hypothetical protein
MKLVKLIFLFLLAVAVPCSVFAEGSGGLVLSPPVLKEVQGKTIVTLRVQNTMPSAVTGARAWVFLMDADGKVVGNQSQWIVTGEAKNALPAGESREFTVSVAATGATQAKVLFPRIVLSDGSTRIIKD